MFKLLTSVLAAALLGGFAQAQSCATLNVTSAPGQNPSFTVFTFALHGDAHAPAGLAIGPTTGSTSIALGSLGTLDLGLARPFDILFIGVTDAAGDVSHVIRAPNSLPGRDLHAQGFTVTFTQSPHLALSFCTSNVALFHIGT
jgi:hypothetical protein